MKKSVGLLSQETLAYMRRVSYLSTRGGHPTGKVNLPTSKRGWSYPSKTLPTYRRRLDHIKRPLQGFKISETTTFGKRPLRSYLQTRWLCFGKLNSVLTFEDRKAINWVNCFQIRISSRKNFRTADLLYEGIHVFYKNNCNKNNCNKKYRGQFWIRVICNSISITLKKRR